MMDSRENDLRLLLLRPEDDILVVVQRIAVGDRYNVAGTSHVASADLGLGHKVALRDIAPGERVLKYGAPIGRASRAIRAGEHVHVHNLASDYTRSYVLPETP